MYSEHSRANILLKDELSDDQGSVTMTDVCSDSSSWMLVEAVHIFSGKYAKAGILWKVMGTSRTQENGISSQGLRVSKEAVLLTSTVPDVSVIMQALDACDGPGTECSNTIQVG